MKACGFDLITIWPAANAWLAPAPDRFVFADTLWMLDALQARGQSAIVQLIGQNPAQEYMPDCLMRPEMMTTYMNCFWPNPNHPEVDQAIRRFLHQAVDALKAHPAVFAWDVFNEAHFRSEDPFTFEEYRRWLQRKYGDIAKLNTLWHRRYADFSQINPADRKFPYSVWSSLLPAVEFEQFLSENLTAMCAKWTSYVKERDTAHPVIIDGTSGQFLFQDVFGRNSDEFATARTCDIYGGTYYPKSWGRNHSETPWNLSAFFKISQSAAEQAGRPFFVTELQTHTQSALTPGSEVEPEALAAWIWTGISAGALAFQLWRWRPFLHGYQTTGRGLTELDGSLNQRATKVQELVRILRTHELLFAGARPVNAAVRIAVSYRSRLVADTFLGGRHGRQHEALLGFYKLAWHVGLPVSFVDLETFGPEHFATTPVLVLPSMMCVSESQAETLTDYVHRGGVVIADARLGCVDENLEAPAEGLPGKALSELFAVRERDVCLPQDIAFRGATIKASFMSQILEAASGTEVLGTDAAGRPAVTVNRAGQGRAVYFNTFLGESLYKELPDELAEFFLSLVLEAAPATPYCRKDARVHAAFLENGQERLAFFVNLDTKDAAATVVNGGVNGPIRKLISGGETAMPEVRLKPFETEILCWRTAGVTS
jgi:beta-galactosidase